MLTRKVRVQVLAFVVVALSAVAFIGGKYAGLGQLFGGSGYVVSLRLADGGGVFTNGEVTYRGVAVGRVGELRLTDEGMEVDLLIDGSAPPIPVNSAAVVSNRSAVGEQYVDLQPRTADGPFLAEGSAIPMESTKVPLPVQDLLGNLSSLNASVPTDALRTVVDEFYDAFHGAGPDLQVLLDSSTAFTRTASEHLPQTRALLTDGTTVLQTQLDSADAWKSFAGNAKLFANELASADGDLRALIGTAPQAATQLSALLHDTDPSLSILLANLLTTTDLFATRTAGMEELFVTIPQAVAATSTSIDPVSGELSIIPRFVEPGVCTQGYESTPRRSPLDLSPQPMNTEAACTLPKGSPVSVRGSQNSPKGGVPPIAVPGAGALAGPLTAPSLPEVSTDMEDLLWLPN